MTVTRHTAETAPAGSISILRQIEADFGAIPDAYAIFAESPATIATYFHASRCLREQGTLTPQQQQLVMLAISVENECGYCVAAHSRGAATASVSAETLDTLRQGGTPRDPADAVLVTFARAVLTKGGKVAESERDAFSDAGFTAAHALEVVALIALKVLSNFANHLTRPEIDACLQDYRWSPACDTNQG